MKPADADTGSASITAVGLIAVMIVVAGALGTYGAVRVAAHRAAAAADLSALAGADIALGRADGEPCGAAQENALRNRTSLTDCRVEGEDVVVTACAPVAILGHRCGPHASARAGPSRELP